MSRGNFFKFYKRLDGWIFIGDNRIDYIKEGRDRKEIKSILTRIHVSESKSYNTKLVNGTEIYKKFLYY